MKKKAVIKLCGLSTGYRVKNGNKIVASDISTEILGGELTCLLGANGAGKSTLLRTLSGFIPPVSGDILINGRSLGSYTSAEMSRILSVVLTERCEIRNMSVEELVGMGRSPYTGFWGRLSKTDMEIVSQSLSMVGILELRHRMVHTLSDGERQKVMIAKALTQQTPIIFLDEPTAFLDYPSKVEIMQLLHGISRETGKTIFLSTHDLELALQIADRLWLMDRNNGVVSGTPEDLSMDGTLGSFFSHKDITFDIEQGLFRITNSCTRSIMVKGEGVPYKMLCKALQRNGIMVRENAVSGLVTMPSSASSTSSAAVASSVFDDEAEYIEAISSNDYPNGYQLISEGKCRKKFASIDEVLEWVV